MQKIFCTGRSRTISRITPKSMLRSTFMFSLAIILGNGVYFMKKNTKQRMFYIKLSITWKSSAYWQTQFVYNFFSNVNESFLEGLLFRLFRLFLFFLFPCFFLQLFDFSQASVMYDYSRIFFCKYEERFAPMCLLPMHLTQIEIVCTKIQTDVIHRHL